ncbi:hypothetical protein BDK51DRAFT_15094, partial [Blyttiomyces helicus]
REHITDHKFDQVDVDDFVEDSCTRQMSYSWVFAVTLKAILVYMADIGVVMLIFISNQSGNPLGDGWLQLGTVVLSFLLLGIEWKKGLAIVKSLDISYAFTSTVAYRYYVIRSYAHFCFFEQIQNSRRTVDVLAFFVFFTFRGWKRLLLAEFPRALLNFLNLYDVLSGEISTRAGIYLINPATGKETPDTSNNTYIFITRGGTAAVATWLTAFSVLIWTISAISLVVAFFIYVPLLCNIRGNLKEYCCHKIDKRISELLRKKSRKRIEAARKAEIREIEKYGGRAPGGPTLPNV